ncbi:MAG: molybdopterin cofactor-binding domain-containing protein [Bacillota bacterium]
MPSTGAASLLWDGKLWAASLRLNEDGTINLSLGASDTGQGSNTVMAQIAADTIGVPAQWVMVSGRDTDVSPLDIGNCASRTTSVVGNAVRQAALKIREAWVPGRHCPLPAPSLEVEPATGRVRVTRLVSAQDVGRAINPMLIRSSE